MTHYTTFKIERFGTASDRPLPGSKVSLGIHSWKQRPHMVWVKNKMYTGVKWPYTLQHTYSSVSTLTIHTRTHSFLTKC